MALVGNISGSSAYNSNIGISGSVVIANRPDALFPTLGSIGGDVVFFVSGSRGGKGSTAERTVSVFGGDAVVSGSLTIGTGSVTITSNDVQFNAFDTRIESGSGGLTFFDAGNTGGITLSSLAASSGDVVGPASSTTNAIAAYADTTGNLLKDTSVTIDASNNVIIPGNLTVNGTTTTIDTVNLIVEDPVIYFGSGSVGENRNGGIALASGSSVTNQALVWGRVADDTWGAGRLDVTNGTETNLTGMTLLPVRASKFELGGSTAFVTSSDGTNISITHGSTSTTTFTKAGTPVVQIGDYAGSGEGQIKGVTTANALAPLWISGSAVNIGSPTVAFIVNDIQQATINPQTGGAGVRFEGQDGTGAPRAMVISGSQTTLGANNRLVVLEGAGVPFLTASSNAAFNTVSLTPGAGFITANIAHDVATTVNFAAGGSIARTVNLGTGAAAQSVTVGSQNTTSALTLQAGSGNVSITGAPGTAYTIGAVGTLGTITVGQSTDSNTINIGNANTADTKTQTIQIGAGTPVSTGKAVITIGNTNGASKIDLKAGSGNIVASAHLVPNTDRGFDLGATNLRWNNIYTGDLHLKNERGDYTLIEEEDFLSIRFNKTGKRYKFLLEPVPELDEK